MLLDIMENVRRVAVFGVENGEAHFVKGGRFGVGNGGAHFCKVGRFAVENGGCHIVDSGRGQVQNNQPGYFSLEFRGNVISAAEMRTESAIAHTLRSLEQITPTW